MKDLFLNVLMKLNPPKMPELVFVLTPKPQDEDCVCDSFFWGVTDFLWPIISKGTLKITQNKKNLGMDKRFDFFN
jgi:hypothetical protein